MTCCTRRSLETKHWALRLAERHARTFNPHGEEPCAAGRLEHRKSDLSDLRKFNSSIWVNPGSSAGPKLSISAPIVLRDARLRQAPQDEAEFVGEPFKCSKPTPQPLFDVLAQVALKSPYR